MGEEITYRICGNMILHQVHGPKFFIKNLLVTVQASNYGMEALIYMKQLITMNPLNLILRLSHILM